MNYGDKVILSKIETVYATDPVPTGAANSVETEDFEIVPIEADEKTRNIDKGQLGAKPSYLVNRHVTCSFKMGIAGAGAAGTVPKYGTELRASALSETASVGVDVQYQPVSTGFESLTRYFNLDGVLHKMLGVRNNLGLLFEAADIPRFTVSSTGLLVMPTTTAQPTAVWTGWTNPIPVEDANTPTFTMGGIDIVLKSLNLNLGNKTPYRNLVNQETVRMVDREVTGTLVIDVPALATKDFFAQAISRGTVAMSLVHGITAGNIVQLDAPKVEVGKPNYTNDDGIGQLTLPIRLLPNAGDDEMKLTVK